MLICHWNRRLLRNIHLVEGMGPCTVCKPARRQQTGDRGVAGPGRRQQVCLWQAQLTTY